MPVVTAKLTQRLEQTEGRCWWVVYEEMSRDPQNPWGLDVRRFGDAWVYSCTLFPRPGFANKVIGAGAGDIGEIEQALALFRQRGVKGSVEIAPGDDEPALYEYLREQGLFAKVFCSVLYGEPTTKIPSLPPGVKIRLAETQADMALVARIHREGMGISEPVAPFFAEMAFAAHRLPGFRHYIAEVEGQPAAQAWLFVAEGVGSMVAGATLPAFRGRGLQTALLYRRIADAAAAGCDLVCSQTDPVSISQNNIERVGMHLAYTKLEFHPLV